MVIDALADAANRSGLSPIVYVVGAIGLFYILRVAVAMRQGVAWVARVGVLVLGVSASAFFVLVGSGIARSHAELLAVLAGFVAFYFTPRRTRHIPAEVRRMVLKRDLKGKRVRAGEYHIDHTWPHVFGGSNTADNLRAIPKLENLKKGKKTPSLRDFL